MHTTTGRWRYGLSLTLVTVFLWGSLPIPLKMLLDVMDPYTITWTRCLTAAILLGTWLALRSRLPELRKLSRRDWALLAIAIIGLASNYILYILGLQFIAPGAAQVVIQLAPMFLLLGGLFVFGEHFRPMQWFGFAILTGGLLLYFHDRLGELIAPGSYAIGVAIVVLAGLMWACYAMAQKQLLKTLPSEAIMWCIYAAAVLVFLPAIHPSRLLQLDGVHIALLAYASLNTLVAYGCFAEALDHWEASRVSALLAVTPLLTIVIVAWLAKIAPHALAAEPHDWLSIVGAGIVVIGSGLSALAPRESSAAKAAAVLVPRE